MSNTNTSGLITLSRKMKYVSYFECLDLLWFKSSSSSPLYLPQTLPTDSDTRILCHGIKGRHRSWKMYPCNKRCSCKVFISFRHSRSSGSKLYWHGLNTLLWDFIEYILSWFNFENHSWYFTGFLVFFF